MESIYLLVPISVILVFGIALAFWWSVRSGQFDDLEGPGFRLLMDDDMALPKDQPTAVSKDAEAAELGAGKSDKA